MKEPLVSVLMPAYNASNYINDAISSVLAQTWLNIEIIVVDDGSQDDTRSKIELLARQYPQIIVSSQPNAGASAARNKAFSLSTGEYIQYLDADDLLHPDKIRAQLACLRQRPAAKLSSSAWGMFYDQPDEQTLPLTVLCQDYYDPIQWLLTAWENGVWMQPSAWLTHRSLIEAAGTWNERISLHDDGEFFSRVLLQTHDIIFCAEAKSFYRKGLSNSLSSIKSEKATRSHLAVCEAYEQTLRGMRDDAQTRQGCANQYQRFIYEYYPLYPALRQVAAGRVRALGGSTARPFGTPAFQLVTGVLGWRLSKRLQNFVYQRGLNPAVWFRR